MDTACDYLSTYTIILSPVKAKMVAATETAAAEQEYIIRALTIHKY